jgi:glycosyltransferase involved in cell wall biosynthesis
MVERKSVAIVVPAYNEQDVLREFHGRLSGVLDGLEVSSEIVYVNDGSSDDTLAILEQLQTDDPRVGIVDLSRNFGKEAALTAGIKHAQGDAVIVIDADLQDPPELITEFIRVWQTQSANVVYAQRTERAGESWLKKTTASLFYRVMQRTGKIQIPRDTGDFRLMDRRAVDALNQLPEHHRFMKGLFTWIGFNQVAIPYRRDPRYAGESKFNYWRLWNFAIEGFTSFSVIPLQVASYLGFVVAFSTLIYAAYIVIKTLVFGDTVQGYPSLMVAILFMGSIQLVFIGIVGEYLGRVYNETKQRPLYLVKSFEPPSPNRKDDLIDHAGFAEAH